MKKTILLSIIMLLILLVGCKDDINQIEDEILKAEEISIEYTSKNEEE